MAGRVLVTGASSGIGEATARHLATLGFEVLAGVRRDEDAERIAAVPGIDAVRLDVTDPASIAAAAERAGDGDGGLAGLVNNAGVAITGPLEFMPIEELRRQLEINVIGQVAVTQALLPALRRARGRIVNISSVAGRVALPLAGPYAASKYALEAISDSLRREVASQGVRVVVVEPGGIRTPIWQKGTADADRIEAAAPPEARSLYGAMADSLRKEAEKIASETGLPPQAVADVVGEALTADRPRTRYLVGRDAKLRATVARVLPDRVMDRLIGRALG
jgi:NAD(P)-dependent dehydrogenase (short-subunit alcohol dehydrogenase family)